MNENTLHIKNMVCPRCIMAVKEILEKLDISYQRVDLGQVILAKSIDEEQLQTFENSIKAVGFELLEPGKSLLISKIKTIVIEQIHHQTAPMSVNFSTLITDKLPHDYSYLSRLFSSIEGITIEKFIASQKIEKVKEFLVYNQMSLSEIADKMNYSSVSYLSTQFKKETGLTPTQFKAQQKPNRKFLDEL